MQKIRPLRELLNDTTAAANVPAVAKEGIISLLISIVANEATSTVSGLTYENLLRTLIMFLVILAIIHYSLKIMEQIRRKSANLGDLQGANTRKALKDLNHSRSILDRLIQESTEVTELRNLRNKLTTVISDIQNPNLSKFGQRSGTVDEFNLAEKALVDSSEKLAKELERQSKEGVDVKGIARLVDSTDDAIRNRIPLSDKLKDLFVESMKKEEQGKKKIPEGTSPELNLYLNALQTKYANNRPELLHTGDYLPDAKWEYETGDRNVTAKLSNGFSGTQLLFEARWQDSNGSIVEVVQEKAEDVKKNQFECLCLVNTGWGKESKDFASRFTHPKLALYLYELNRGLVFNMGSPTAKHYEFWFNMEQKRETVMERVLKFIEGQEYFTAQDMAGAMGMKAEGAEAFLKGLEKKGAVTDVSFKSDKVKKYTKAKAEEEIKFNQRETEGSEALLKEVGRKGTVTEVSFKSDKVEKYTKAKSEEEIKDNRDGGNSKIVKEDTGGQIETELNNAVKKSIKNTIEEARFFFKDESVIHGFFRNELKKHFRESALLKDKEDLILEECKTKLCYQRETGTDHGIPYGSPEYDELRKQGYQPKSAYFDFAIWDPSKEVFDEGRETVPKAMIGIEIKRQKEVDKKEDFIDAVVRDCKKLNDTGNEIKYKYLMIILYYPNVFTLDVESDLGNNLRDVNVAYCVVNKESKQIAQQAYVPKIWHYSNAEMHNDA